MIPLARLNGTGVGGVSFTQIPSNFDHLQIKIMVRGTRSFGAEQIYLNMNGDTSLLYSYHYMYTDGSGGVPVAGNLTSTTLIWMGEFNAANEVANVYSPGIIDIHDYANTGKFKTLKSYICSDNRRNTAVYTGKVWLASGMYQSTNAVNRIDIFSNGPFTTDSTFCLYGIPKVGA